MALIVLRPAVSSRRSKGAPLPAPAAGAFPPPVLRAVPHRLVPPPALRAVGRSPFRRREVPRAPVIRLPVPILKLPPPPPPERAPAAIVRPLGILPVPGPPAVLGVPVPAAAPGAVPALWVGIQGGPGTVVSATPADLTVGPTSDIRNFRVSMDSGVY
jgi:hypothetical protein